MHCIMIHEGKDKTGKIRIVKVKEFSSFNIQQILTNQLVTDRIKLYIRDIERVPRLNVRWRHMFWILSNL